MLSAQRPSTRHGVPGGSQPGLDAAAEFGERPHTAEGNSHGSLATEMADGSFGAADQSGFDASEYRRRLDEFRQMSAPDLLGSSGFADSLAGSQSRLSQADFLRFSRPSKLTGMRDKRKLETMARAYGVSYSQPRRRQLSPVKKKPPNGSALLPPTAALSCPRNPA